MKRAPHANCKNVDGVSCSFVCVCVFADAVGATVALAATSSHVQLIRSTSTLCTVSQTPQGLILVIDWMDGLLSRLLRLGEMSGKYHFKWREPPLKHSSRSEEQETIISWGERSQNQEQIMKIRADDFFFVC